MYPSGYLPFKKDNSKALLRTLTGFLLFQDKANISINNIISIWKKEKLQEKKK